MEINLEQLKDFLFEANAHGYAGESQQIIPQRPGFQDLEYRRGEWYFRDSYAGAYFAPGQEVVYYKDQPVWAMAYAGGMKFEHHNNKELTHNTIVFLKEALLNMDREKPFRGPISFKREKWRYLSRIKGEIKDFTGNESIFYQDNLVFEQNFIGGMIIS
ncbi:MAG: DUF5680 domain-containing protein [bacterium]